MDELVLNNTLDIYTKKVINNVMKDKENHSISSQMSESIDRDRELESAPNDATENIDSQPAPDALETLEAKCENLKGNLDEKAAHCGEEVNENRDKLVSVSSKINEMKSDLQSKADANKAEHN
jgi:predicted  nucleic acid-binding Zn-ribbon protein